MFIFVVVCEDQDGNFHLFKTEESNEILADLKVVEQYPDYTAIASQQLDFIKTV